jgi:hypothetical protein
VIFLRFLSLFAAIPFSVRFAAIRFLVRLAIAMDQKAMTAELDELLAAATGYRAPAATDRAAFLRKIGEEVDALGEELLTVCGEETGLGRDRLAGERVRTVNQLRMFANLIEEGYVVGGILLVVGKKTRAAAAWVGLSVLVVELAVYAPIGIVDRASLDNGLNYVFDTLMFCGTVLLLAGAMPHET